MAGHISLYWLYDISEEILSFILIYVYKYVEGLRTSRKTIYIPG